MKRLPNIIRSITKKNHVYGYSIHLTKKAAKKLKRYLLHHKRTARFVFITTAILVFVIPFATIFLARTSTVEAGWIDEAWRYRKKIPVTAHTSAETNVYITITLDTSNVNKFQTDCGDIRTTKDNGQILPYTIASGCGTSGTTIRILINSFPAGAQDFYVYYGNPDASDGFSTEGFITAASGVTLGTTGSEEIGQGPAGFWKFDEGQGSTSADFSSSGSIATLTPSTSSLDKIVQHIGITNQTVTTTGQTFTPTDNSIGLGNYTATNYTNPTTYLEVSGASVPKTGFDGTTNAGQHTSMYCVSATDCKITYYDVSGGDLKFMDCDDATCGAGTITLVDGGTGCSTTNCSTTDNVGYWTSLDCSAGATDCKISYYDVTNADLLFIDCDNAACSSGTRTRVDGTSGSCIFGSCSTIDTGRYSSLSCTAGATDCKISYYDATNADLIFADCDSATCSSGTRTLVDGTASTCSLTGCGASDSGMYSSIDCVGGATDCKIAYYNATGGDLYFADCGSATCSSGTRQLVDGAAGGITGTTTDNTGSYLSLECPTASNCKIAYYNTTNGDLYFADCDTAGCTTGTVTRLDGRSTCITSCTTDNTGTYVSLDCAPGEANCKISYYNETNKDLYFVDCGSATCATGTVTRLDGNDSCVLTGCHTGDRWIGNYTAIDCIGGDTDCKIVYYNEERTGLMFADCSAATCSSGSTIAVDGSFPYRGEASSIYCVTSSDCKIAHYDVIQGDLLFTDCDNSECTIKTTVVLDGSAACVLSGCSTTNKVGESLAIDCSQGATDCKIAYSDVTNADLMFIDCDNATCTSGTRTVAATDGGGAVDLDCSQGATDCKIAYIDGTGADLVVADCSNAVCSAPTISNVDGDAATGLTGFHSGNITTPHIDCSSGATDCKLSYHSQTNTSLRFADCSNAACSTGSITKIDGETSCVNTPTCGNNTGSENDIDCAGTGTDCKISYWSGTDFALRFVDCSDAACSAATFTILDGETGCVLDGCNTGANTGGYSTLDCSSSVSDCKVAYYSFADNSIYFGDCIDGSCSDGTTTKIDGSSGSSLTGYTTTSKETRMSIYCVSSNDCKISYNDMNGYHSGEGYLLLGDCDTSLCSSGTATIVDKGLGTIARLYTSAGTATGDALSISSDTGDVVQKAVTLTTGTDYSMRIMSRYNIFTATSYAARIVVEQSASAITATQAQIDLANAQNDFSNTSYSTITNSPIFYYDSGQYSGTVTINVEATLHTDVGTNTVYAQLLQCTSASDCTTGSAVASSIISTTGSTNWTRVRSGAITPTSGQNYAIQTRMSAGTGDIANAKLIITQTDASGITETETIIPILSRTGTDTDSTYTREYAISKYSPSKYAASSTISFESSIKTSAGTGYAQLYNASDSVSITSSELTTTSTTFNRVRSSSFSAPSGNIDVELKNSATNTTTAASSWLVWYFSPPASTTVAWANQTTCKRGFCLQFDGSTASAYVNNNQNINITSTDTGFSVGTWVKVLSDGENDVGEIFRKGPENYLRTTNQGSDGYVDLEGSLDLISTNATVTAANALKLNTWHYVTMTYGDDSDDELSIYVDGRLLATSTNGVGSLMSESNRLDFGGGTSANFHGFIDEFKMYRYERTANQIKVDVAGSNTSIGTAFTAESERQLGISSGLMGYWQLNETSGNASDTSGNGITLTNNGTTTYVAAKYYAGSEHVPASSQYLSTASTLSGVKTLSFWVNPDSDTNYYINLTSSAGLTSTSGTLAMSGVTDAAIYVNGVRSTTITQDSWQYITVTFTTEIDANQFYVGRVGSNYFDGTLDEVRIYNRALSAREIGYIYNWAPAPVSYWPLDENTGQTTADKMTAANTGYLGATSSTESTDPQWDRGKIQSSLLFDGTDDKVTVGDPASLDLTYAMTVSAWISKSTSASNYYRIVTKTDGGEANGFVFDITGSNKIRLRINNNDCNGNTDITAANTWYYVTGTFDSSTIKIYINGTLDQTCTYTTAMTANSYNFVIADRSDGNSRFQGWIDDVIVYNYARNPAQVIEDMNVGHPIGGSPIGSQVLYWRFDEGQGTTANSAVSGRQNGTLTNISSPATSTSGWNTTGKFDKSIMFDGSDDKVVVATANDADIDFNGSEQFSISTWIYMTTAPTSSDNDFIAGKWDETSAQRGYRMILKNDDNDTTGHIQIQIYDESADQTITVNSDNDSISPNTWYNIMFAFNGGTSGAANDLALYINGKKIKTNAANASFLGLEDVTSDFTVGDYDATDAVSGNTAFTGEIDEVQIYNTALTDEQADVIYNANSSVSVSNGTTEQSQSVDGAGNAPIVLLTFDNMSGTSVKDISGNENTLTLASALGAGIPEPIRGKNDQALYIPTNGTIDTMWSKATFANNSFDSLTTGTLSFWFKPDDTGDNFQDMFYAGDDTGSTANAIEIGFRSDTNQIEVWTNGCSSNINYVVDIPGKVTDWHHITITMGTAGNTIYLDGTLVTPTYSTGTSNTECFFDEVSEGTTIYAFSCTATGTDCQSTENYVGAIDDFKLYNYVRSASQIAYDYNRGKPIAYWKLDECEGTTAYDSSGQTIRSDGTITPGASGNTAAGTCTSGTSTDMWYDGATGKRNASLGFDGTDDYIQVTDTNTLRFDSSLLDFSIFAWVKRTTTGTQYIISKEDADNDGWRMLFDSSNYLVCSIDSIDITSTKAITDTNWHHVGCTIDRDGNGQVYIDGLANGTATAISSEVMATTSNIRIGTRSYTSTNYFSGLIDDVRIYAYPLSAEEVKKALNDGSAVRFAPNEGEP